MFLRTGKFKEIEDYKDVWVNKNLSVEERAEMEELYHGRN